MEPSPESPTPGAPRLPTSDANRYVLPVDRFPPALAERLRGPYDPVAPRSAATVVLLRDTAGGPEALLLRRHGRSGFAAGAWVFPGGVLDGADRHPDWRALCRGPAPEQWATRLGLSDPGEGLGFAVAALREAWEETGLLLAREDAAAATRCDPHRRERVAGARDQSLAGDPDALRRLLTVEGLRLATADLEYLAHWVTPEPELRRYDTRFFFAAVADGGEVALHEPEAIEARWLGPGAAVEAFVTGELPMLPPTVDTLRRLAPFSSVAEARAGLAEAPVETIMPRMSISPEGIVIEVESRK